MVLAIALASSGTIAMLGFWLYWAEPIVGKAFSWATLIVSLAVVVWTLSKGGLDGTTLRQLASPLALWALGTTFLVFLGFNHGGTPSPLVVPQYRFTSFGLPTDNGIPAYFAGWFYAHGHSPPPPLYPGLWMFSDRPPMQVGYVLMQMPMGLDRAGLNYQLVGVCLQQLWIVGLWALLLAARLGRVTRGLAALSVLVSDLAIVNGFFVWPKLLPAAMLLAAAALVITPEWIEVRRKPALAALVGVLLALSMLGHGASIFGVIPLGIVAVVRGLPTGRWLFAVVISGLALYLPWQAYQKYSDPPGNRLVKESLAGDDGFNHRGVLSDAVSAYRETGLGGTLHDKAENFVAIAGGGPAADLVKNAVVSVVHGRFHDADAAMRTMGFFYLLPSLGLLLIGAPLIALGRWRNHIRSAEWSFATTAFAVFVLGTVLWGLIMFGNQAGGAVIHEGSYLLPILGFCALVAGTRATFPRTAVWLVALNVVLSLIVYFPSLTPPPGTRDSATAIAVMVLSLAAFAIVALADPSRLRPRRAQLSTRGAQPPPQIAQGNEPAIERTRVNTRARPNDNKTV